MNYDVNMQYHYAFACTLHPGEDHLCTLYNKSDKVMACSRDEEIEYPDLTWKQKVWFDGKHM